jgi:4-hydroxybenzoyl-CoA reductase subunit beta
MLRLSPCTATFPRTVAEAVAEKVAHGGAAAYVAGGTDLYPNMKRRVQTPAHVIDIRGIPALRQLETLPDGRLAIGACVTLTELIRHPAVGEGWPVVSQAAALISTPLLQNMGTIGGNLLLDTRCNYYDQGYEWRKAIDFCMKKDGDICWVAPSSPRCWAVQSSDLVPVMVALDASMRFDGPDGARTVRARDLYLNDGIKFLAKRPDELLTTVELPSLAGARASYEKLRRRGSFDFPVLGVAAWARMSGGTTVAEARIVIGAVGSAPLVSDEAAGSLVGKELSDEAIDQAARIAARPAKPLDNTDFTIGWRKDIVPVYVRRALEALR